MATEMQIASKLITAALKAGYAVSVYDGEDWPVKRSHDRAEIIAALASTDMDRIRLRDADGFVGDVLLIWGNGEDLISDHSDNSKTNAIVASVN